MVWSQCLVKRGALRWAEPRLLARQTGLPRYNGC